eukprot:1971417-Amphidinium_carterae.1
MVNNHTATRVVARKKTMPVQMQSSAKEPLTRRSACDPGLEICAKQSTLTFNDQCNWLIAYHTRRSRNLSQGKTPFMLRPTARHSLPFKAISPSSRQQAAVLEWLDHALGMCQSPARTHPRPNASAFPRCRRCKGVSVRREIRCHLEMCVPRRFWNPL